jgi:hypothetical protein
VISVLGGVGSPQVRAGEFAERVKLPLEAIDRLRTPDCREKPKSVLPT